MEWWVEGTGWRVQGIRQKVGGWRSGPVGLEVGGKENSNKPISSPQTSNV